MQSHSEIIDMHCEEHLVSVWVTRFLPLGNQGSNLVNFQATEANCAAAARDGRSS
jgi:hypothetical protein